jgi:putative protein-disulfide isomerase
MASKHIIELVQFTDPVCMWCWGSEPLLRKLEIRFGDQVRSSFVMGGLVRDIRDFYDDANDIGGTPEAANEQIARHWEEAFSRHGMPVETKDYHLFTNEYPSTYPQNIAYKAAQMEDEVLANRFLRRIREASSAEGRQTNAIEVLIELASEVGLDLGKFLERMEDGTARSAFEKDQQLCARLGIHGFPTFVVKYGEKAVVLRGWQQYDTIKRVMQQMAGGVLVERDVDASDEGILAFIEAHGSLAAAEIQAAFDLSPDQTEGVIARLESRSSVERRKVGSGSFVRSATAPACSTTTGLCHASV